MYPTPDDIEDEITPQPRPTFPSLPPLPYAFNPNHVAHTSNHSFPTCSDTSSSSLTTEPSNSSLQDCSIVSLPPGSETEQTKSYMDFISQTLYRETVAANIVEMKRKFTNELTDEEQRRGFRVCKQPDPRYLGFIPSSNDRRKYLAAMPLASIKSPAYVGFYLPVSMSQRLVLFVFVLIVLLLSAAATYFFRSMIVGHIVLHFRAPEQ